ncbi:MAG: fatty acid--CoA ligase [Terriglobia bacterium]
MNVPLTPVRFLRYAVEQFPRKTGIICEEQRFTYAQFGERVGRGAGALRGLGVEPGDRVAFLSTNCHRLLEAYYGVVEAGGVLLPLNIRLAPEELAYILNDAGAKLLFLESAFLSIVEAFRRTAGSVESFILLDGEPEAGWLARQNYEELLAGATGHWRDLMEFDENSFAELFYTSGTSADPKGVVLTHRNVYLHGLSAALALGTTRKSVQLHTIPLFHANGWGLAHSLTFMGATHVMLHRFDPVAVFRLVERERVEAFSVVPTMATALVNCPERPKYDLSSLKTITIGGAASSPALVRAMEEKLGCCCYSGYGLTETSPVLTLAPLKDELAGEGEQRHRRQAMTGFAIPGVEIRVVDEAGADVPRDGKTMGEIVTRSDGVMEGYWREPEETAQALRGGWFHTGDMATIDTDNYVLIVDRQKEIIISGGENISSLEVEKMLLEHPSVYEVAVIPVPDQKWGEVPKALVALKPGTTASEAELIQFCRARLGHFKVPGSVEFRESLPKGGTGKILKKELRKQYWPAAKKGLPPVARKSGTSSR